VRSLCHEVTQAAQTRCKATDAKRFARDGIDIRMVACCGYQRNSRGGVQRSTKQTAAADTSAHVRGALENITGKEEK